MTSSTTVQQEHTERLDRLEHKIDQLIKLIENMNSTEAPMKIPARIGDVDLPRGSRKRELSVRELDSMWLERIDHNEYPAFMKNAHITTKGQQPQ